MALRFFSFIVLILSFFSPTYAYAQASYISGSDLLRACKKSLFISEGIMASATSEDMLQGGWCVGVVAAARDINAGATEGGLLPRQYGVCLPSGGVINEQAIRIVVHYLEENPHQLHIPAAVVATLAFRGSFPCR